MTRGERGRVVVIVSRLWIGENVGHDQAGMWGGIGRDSVAVMMRIITSLNHTASIVAGFGISITGTGTNGGNGGKGSCEMRAGMLARTAQIACNRLRRILCIGWHGSC